VLGFRDSLLPDKLGVQVDLVDITDLDAVRASVRSNTRLVHTEVVANPDLRVADVAALADIAHQAGALLSVDSTFTPPPMLRPLELGADLVIPSLTKYVNGHGDAMGGAVVADRDLIARIKLGALRHVGGAISPFNAWLIMRGSITLPLRLRRHCDNAAAVADFLQRDSRVAYVAYPGLTNDPGHERATAQLNGGYGGVVAFAIAGEYADRVRFLNDLRLITSAVSLGHDETLVAYEHYPPERAAVFAPPFRDHRLIRLAIGREDPDDIRTDLDAALTTRLWNPPLTPATTADGIVHGNLPWQSPAHAHPGTGLTRPGTSSRLPLLTWPRPRTDAGPASADATDCSLRRHCAMSSGSSTNGSLSRHHVEKRGAAPSLGRPWPPEAALHRGEHDGQVPVAQALPRWPDTGERRTDGPVD